ncbi:MAG: lyase family protein, partial [Gemmataceae bacterium]
YSRKIDTQIMEAVAGIGASLHKWSCDLRLLAHRQEIDEPFEAEQIGSSAMAYKRNPMRAERMTSLSRFLMGLPPMAAQTHATQWFERTLDDSAARRLYIPQAFLAADALLAIATNVARGLIVNRPIIARGVRDHLPYMATENLMMAAVAAGADRQQVHEVVRHHSHATTARIKAGEATAAELIPLLQADPAFTTVDFAKELDPQKYVGRAAEQVDEFLAEELAPALAPYQSQLNQQVELKV